MSGSKLGASKTPEDEWENQWLRALVPPSEPELYSGVKELAGLLMFKDYPEFRPKMRPGEIRQVWRPTDGVCVHRIDLQVECAECAALQEGEEVFVASLGVNVSKAHMTPRRWWRRLLSR